MTLVAGRVPSLHGVDHRPCREDSSMPGILKTGHTHRPNKVVIDKPLDHNQRQEDNKRLVRFCETEERKNLDRCSRSDSEQDAQEVIMLGSNMYFINNPDPNSAVRKLFPNSKPPPINPFLNKQPKSTIQFKTFKTNSFATKDSEGSHNTINRSRTSKSDTEDSGNMNIARRKMDNNTLRRSMIKVSPDAKQKLGKPVEPPTPLIERIKQLTCDDEKDLFSKEQQEERKCITFQERSVKDEPPMTTNNFEPIKHINHFQNKVRDLPKIAKDGINMMRCKESIMQTKSQNTNGTKQLSPTEEARRSFLSSLAHQNEGEAGDRTSLATISTTADTVYSLSDIEEALTEEEKEIRDAFAQEIKQDELELFVQQDAGRTERIRKRYSATPKPENPMPMLFSNNNYPQINSDFQHYPNNTMRKDKPKFGSTVEILQQLQQQIEIPYQLEGRRTACSNYSDTSIPISDRLFCDESSDGYEPVLPKLNMQRTYSLDSKNYEEIDNFPSAFSVPRTKSQEHPRMTHFDSDSYFYPTPTMRYSGNFAEPNHLFDQNLYTSSPDLHRYHTSLLPDSFSLYSNHSVNGKQLHPVLQRQYCRYPASEMSQRHIEEDKVLTPPSRMHTYMNVPTNAPCYLSPPPYSKTNHYTNSPPNNAEYQYGSPYTHSNIYQNVPPPINHHLMTLRRLCTEKERGVPEGASSTQDSKESYISNPKDYCPLIKPSLPRQYCVDV